MGIAVFVVRQVNAMNGGGRLGQPTPQNVRSVVCLVAWAGRTYRTSLTYSSGITIEATVFMPFGNVPWTISALEVSGDLGGQQPPTRPRPQSGRQTVQRRAWRSLSQSEQRRFISAVSTLIADGRYNTLARDHTNFCAHGVETFPAWHRLYVAEFERMLQNADRETGNDGRIAVPYWASEGFQGREHFPALIRQAFPDNTQIGPVTINRNSPDDIRNLLVTSFLDRQVGNSLDVPQHRIFASGNSPPSLEASHNLVHVAIGYPMGDINMAAYDPIFFLHHANVDRLYESYLRYESDSRNEFESNQRFRQNMGQPNLFTSPLAPFQNPTTGRLYTAADTFNTAALGYTYDRLARRQPQRIQVAPTVAWFKDIEVMKMGGSYQVHVFVKRKGTAIDIPAFPTQYPGDLNYAGMGSIFQRGEGCGNCETREPYQVYVDISEVLKYLGISRYECELEVMCMKMSDYNMPVMPIKDTPIPFPIIAGPAFENRDQMLLRDQPVRPAAYSGADGGSDGGDESSYSETTGTTDTVIAHDSEDENDEEKVCNGTESLQWDKDVKMSKADDSGFTVSYLPDVKTSDAKETERMQKEGDTEVVQARLKMLGYYSGEVDGNFGQDTENAVARFQMFSGKLNIDGVAGPKTKDTLLEPRCSHADFQLHDTSQPQNVSSSPDEPVQGQTNDTIKSIFIGEVPGKLDRERTVREIQLAFDSWSPLVDMVFELVDYENIADIVVGWTFEFKIRDDRVFRFDGEGLTLARATPSRLYFDRAENWLLQGSERVEHAYYLLPVALHEVGHVLGLPHSSNPADVMSPFYRPFVSLFTDNDISAARNVRNLGKFRPKRDLEFYTNNLIRPPFSPTTSLNVTAREPVRVHLPTETPEDASDSDIQHSSDDYNTADENDPHPSVASTDHSPADTRTGSARSSRSGADDFVDAKRFSEIKEESVLTFTEGLNITGAPEEPPVPKMYPLERHDNDRELEKKLLPDDAYVQNGTNIANSTEHRDGGGCGCPSCGPKCKPDCCTIA